jgi:hypothetical protein
MAVGRQRRERDGNEGAFKKESTPDEVARCKASGHRKEEAEVVQQDRGRKGRLPQAAAGADGEE